METFDSPTESIEDIELEKEVVPSNEICKELLSLDYIEEPQKVLQQLSKDHIEVSKRYGIPLFLDSNSEFKVWSKSLKSFAENNGAEVVFVDKKVLSMRGMSAGYDEERKKIAIEEINLDKCSEGEALIWGSKFSHELVHHMQGKINPDMPIERSEYEAYVVSNLFHAMYGARKLVSSPGYLRDFETVSQIFDGIEESCRSYYAARGVSPEEISWMKDQ